MPHLLAPDEPPPFEILNPEAASPWLLQTDNAARAQLANVTGPTPVLAGSLRVLSATDFRKNVYSLHFMKSCRSIEVPALMRESAYPIGILKGYAARASRRVGLLVILVNMIH